MFTEGALAFAGIISLGLFFWRLSRLIDRKVIEPAYVGNDNGSVSVITRKGISDSMTHNRRNSWATLWLSVQHLLLVAPLAYVVGGIRYNKWADLDGGAIILGIVFLGVIALTKAHTKKNLNPKSGRGVFTYNIKLTEGLAWAGVILGVTGVLTQIWLLAGLGLLSVVCMMTHIWIRNRKAVKEFREDNPDFYNN